MDAVFAHTTVSPGQWAFACASVGYSPAATGVPGLRVGPGWAVILRVGATFLGAGVAVCDFVVGAATLRHSATYAFSVFPAARFAALLARHSALQAAADFCWAKAEYDGATTVAKTIPQSAAMDNVLICESYVLCLLLAAFTTRIAEAQPISGVFVISAGAAVKISDQIESSANVTIAPNPKLEAAPSA